MSDRPRAQGGEGDTESGPKPSIAEVAAWLRRAAEQRDSIEDLRPAPRPAAHQGPPPAGGPNRGQGGAAVADQEPADRLPDPPPDPEATTEARADRAAARERVVDEPPPVPEQPGAAPHEQGPVGPDGWRRAEDPPTVEVPVVELAAQDEPAEVSEPATDEAVEVLEPPADEAVGHEPPFASVEGEQAEAAAPPSHVAQLADDPGDDGPTTDAQHPDAAAGRLDLPGPDEEPEPVDGDRKNLGAPEASAVDSPSHVGSPGPDEGALAVNLPAGAAVVDASEIDPPESSNPAPADPADPADPIDLDELDDVTDPGGPADRGDPADPAGADEGDPVDLHHPGHRADADLGDPSGLVRHAVPPDAQPSSAAELVDEPAPGPGPDEPTAPDAADSGTTAVTGDEPDLPRILAQVDADLEVSTDRDAGRDADPEERPPRPPVPAPGLQALSSGGSSVASLFDLDLAELASRARANAEARMASISPPSGLDGGTDAGVHGAEVHRVDRDTRDDQPVDVRDVVHAVDLAVDPSDDNGEADDDHRSGVLAPPRGRVDPPFDHTSPFERADGSIDLIWEGGSDRSVPAGDVELDEELAEELDDDALDDEARAEPAAKAKLSSVAASATTVLRSRRAKRKRYPRGQLKEKIGLLRRVRAMLGVVVLTIVLGVAAGAAIGAFLLFLAFAIRGAITSS